MEKKTNSIFEHWPMLLGLATLIFSGGSFYAQQRAQTERLNSNEERIQRQYETMRGINNDIQQLKEWQAYQKGYEQARKELNFK